MDNGKIEGSAGNEFASPQGVQGGRKYRPVVAHDNDRAMVEMSSLDPGSSSSVSFPNRESSLKKIKVSSQPNLGFDAREGSLPTHVGANGPRNLNWNCLGLILLSIF